jgi:hypothetical protein
VLRTAQGLLPHAPSSSRGFQVPQLQCHAMRNNAPAAGLSKSNQRLWGCHLAFGVHIDLITSMANLEVFRISYFFCPPGAPGPLVHPLGSFYKTDFPPLSGSLLLLHGTSRQPPFGHIQAAPRQALLPLGSSPGLVLWPVSELDFLLVGS